MTKRDNLTLRAAARWHLEQAAYWEMTRKQAWGRPASIRASHREAEQVHRRFAAAIQRTFA